MFRFALLAILAFLVGAFLTWVLYPSEIEADGLDVEVAEVSLASTGPSEQDGLGSVSGESAEQLSTKKFALVYRLKQVTAELETKRILGSADDVLSPLEAELTDLTNQLELIDQKLAR